MCSQKEIYLKNILVSCFFFLLPFIVFSQENNTLIPIGGISFKDQTVLEKAIFGVLYEFEQQTAENGKEVQLKDTLLLAIGHAYSIFLDPLYKEKLEKSRKERKSRSLKAKRVNMKFENENVENFRDLINAGSDYKEEGNGYPVQIYKNRNTEDIISIFNAFVDNLQCRQSISEMKKWNLTEETDTILGYPCLKATTRYGGRNYTAWFTIEIPINDGPWKFHGLPGLILKAHDDAQIFLFKAVGIEQYKNEVVIVKDNVMYDTGTLQQFNKFVEKETGQNIVSFYNNGELYMTYKKSPVTLTPMEIIEK